MWEGRKFKSLRWFNGLMVGSIFHFEQLIRLVFGVWRLVFGVELIRLLFGVWRLVLNAFRMDEHSFNLSELDFEIERNSPTFCKG
jgi:hypothetical protein